MEYKDFNDYELLSFINEKDEVANEILLKKYEPLICTIAKRFAGYCGTLGFDINDLIQEGRIGLSIAIPKYREDRDEQFYTYAKVCIERRIISTIIRAKRQKNKILNESLSIETDIDSEIKFENILGDYSNIPENRILDHELTNEVMEYAQNNLTDYEYQVFELRIEGFDYKEIAILLDKNFKAIDNAIQRIKFKFKKLKEDWNA